MIRAFSLATSTLLIACAAPARPPSPPASCPPAAKTSAAPPAAKDDAARALYALFDDAWETRMREEPTWASKLGDHRYDDKWPDQTMAAFDRRQAERKDALAKLHAIDRARLPAAAQLDYDLFERELAEEIEGHDFRYWLAAVSHQDGPQDAAELADALRFRSRQDYEGWLARLRAFGAYVDQTIALMRQGMKERIVQPRAIMQRVPES